MLRGELRCALQVTAVSCLDRIGHWMNMTLNPRLCVRLSAPVSFLAVIHASGRSLSLRFRHLRCRFQVQSRYRRSEEHTSELQSLMRISYAVFCLKKKKTKQL